MNKIKIYFKILAGVCLIILPALIPAICRAMPPGSLVYRTSSEGKMFGYSGDTLMYSEKGIMKNIYPGHVGIYIGQENGVDYVVEAMSGGIVKTPADKFVNEAEGEKYLGAKIPKGLTVLRQAKVVALAKSLVGKKLAYDFDFKTQKGPGSGEWTCVGLTEKLYESADISNPNNLEALEYNFGYYAIDITEDGFDNSSVINQDGDCFSKKLEFSKIARRKNLLLPAPELIGYDLGLERNGDRYVFLPYTQFLQPTLENVTTDIKISSSFSGLEVRGPVNNIALVLRWSLLNNPISTIKTLAEKVKNFAVGIKDSIFGTGSAGTEVAVEAIAEAVDPATTNLVKVGAVITKAVQNSNTKKETAKTTASKTVSEKNNAGQSVSQADSKTSGASVTKASVKPASTTQSKTSDTPVKAASTAKTSSSTSTYYNPVQTPVTTVSSSNSGSSGSWSNPSSLVVDNTPKIATINKIYSTGDNNWIELYNTGDNDFDLAAAAYRLEKAKTAEDPSLIMRIGDTDDGSYPGGTVIKAHSSYLIVKNTASSYYLSKADAIANREDFKWPGSAYTIYLGTGAISSSNDSDIVEAVGFGTDATYFQGKAAAPEITDNYILKRIKNTKDNSIDFSLVKSDDPSIDWTEPVEPVASSTENVSTSTDNISTSTEIISTSTSTISSSSLILINKIHSTDKNDWIELYNPNNYDFDLAKYNYRLEKTKTSVAPSILIRIGDALDGSYPGGTIIKAHGKYLIVRGEANDFFKSKADTIATRDDFSWLDSGYTFYLSNGPISSNTDISIIDYIGFGSDATYWQGSGPAEALKDNYLLSRKSSSFNNNLDFELIKSDDPNIDWSQSSNTQNDSINSNGIYNFSASSYNLFPSQIPINSSGLTYLWHFDECRGTTAISEIGSTALVGNDHWLAGKYICSKEILSNFEKSSAILERPVDANNFSLSFWFRQTETSPRLSLLLSNSNNEGINITLENGLMQFDGLPNANWRYFQEFPFDNTWRQATLVINRNEGYWSLYVDGVEKMHIESYKLFPSFNNLEISTSNGPFAIDELAMWDRALSQDEVIDLRNREQPFNPFTVRSPQEKPALKHFWNFNEAIGTITHDLTGSSDMTVNKDNWHSYNLVNSSLLVDFYNSLKVNIPKINSPDLSLTFWWRSLDTTTGNKLSVALRNNSVNNILTLYPSQYLSAYNFNGNLIRFGDRQNLTIPLDTNWHQFSLVYDSYRNLISYYADGVLKDSRNLIWSANRPLTDAIEIIAENGQSEIDNLGIWEGALSSAQIQQIFANN